MILLEPGWQVCGEAADAAEAMRLVDKTKPDLVIVDISLGQTNGIDLIKTLCGKDAELPMLVLSMLGRLPDRSGTVNHPPPTFSRGRTFILFFPCPKLR